MSVWSKWFGDKAASQPALGEDLPTLQRPTTVTLVPKQLTASFTLHDTAESSEGRFLSAVSHGLSARGQREIVLTLRLTETDDLKDLVTQLGVFFKMLLAWARERQFVDAGGFTQFGERALFGRPKSGLLYAAARPLPGVELPPDTLAAVLVDPDEVRLAIDHGTYRVLTRLGEQQRHFPFPTWSERKRASVYSARESESLLAKMLRTRANGVSFLVQGKRMRILLAPSVRSVLGRGVSALTPGAPFALLTKPAADASAILVWHPGQTERTGISADGSDLSRMSGSSLLIVPGGQHDEMRCVEDGYSLLFSDGMWDRLYAALLTQKPILLRMADTSTVELEWLTEETN